MTHLYATQIVRIGHDSFKRHASSICDMPHS